MSPLLKSVEKAGIRGLRLKRNPSLITAADFFDEVGELRTAYAKLINAADDKRIAVIPSVSYGMANVIHNVKLKKGDHVVVAAEQFPSNYYPWQRLCSDSGAELKSIAPPEGLVDRGKGWNVNILESISKNTRVVAIANTHWTDGTKFDLVAIRKRTTEVGALLIIDGTQSVGALPFDVSEVRPDALICAGYKWLLGPYGIGVAYYSEYFDGQKPVEESWLNRLNSEDFTGLVNYQSEYHPGARRYEVGERGNFILIPMMLKAIEQISRWGVANIQEYCVSISRNAIEKLREKDFWIEDEPYRAGHIIGLRLPQGKDVEKVKAALFKNKINVSFRGSAIRVAPNVYNDENDLKKLVRVLIAS
jgi:selenocysteine lyase/cysteine desulfurase